MKGTQNENIGFNTMYDAASVFGRSIAQVLYILELVFDSDEIVFHDTQLPKTPILNEI